MQRLMTKATFSGLLMAGVMSSPTFAVEALKDNKVLMDSQGQAVHAIRSGNCVRTQWETASDQNPCASVKPPKARYTRAQSPAHVLSKADRTIYFEFDSAELDTNSKRRLDRLAMTLKRSGDVLDADIIGFADKIGSKNYNINLSQRRAKAVKDYLASQGYINTRVAETRGLGETKAYTRQCEEKTTSREGLIKCLQPNRRVEVEMDFVKEAHAAYQHPSMQR